MHYMFNPKTWLSFVSGRKLTPDYHIKTLADLPIDELKSRGIEGLVMDVDNTLTDHHGPAVRADISDAFGRVNESFRCVIYSNCDSKRHSQLQTMFEIPIVPCGLKKPEPEGFFEALRLLELPAHKVAIVGDRVLTDILGGNRRGFTTVLVDAFGTKEPALIAGMRRLERLRIGL